MTKTVIPRRGKDLSGRQPKESPGFRRFSRPHYLIDYYGMRTQNDAEMVFQHC